MIAARDVNFARPHVNVYCASGLEGRFETVLAGSAACLGQCHYRRQDEEERNSTNCGSPADEIRNPYRPGSIW